MPDRCSRLRVRDELCLRHGSEYGLGALFGTLGIAVWGQPRRRFHQARKHRGFRQRNVLRGFSEIALRRGLDAIGAGTEINPVEVELENLGLGMLALQPEREFDFLQFSLKRALLRQKQILGELLRQRRATLRNAAMQDVGHRRAGYAQRIDSVMRIEPAVLDRNEGLRQIEWEILQRDVGAGHLAARRQHAAVEADDLDRRRPLRNFEGLDRRQMRADPDDDAHQRDYRPQAEHCTPIEQPVESASCPPPGSALAARATGARLSLARCIVIGIVRLAFGRWLFRRFVGGGDAIPRT